MNQEFLNVEDLQARVEEARASGDMTACLSFVDGGR